MRLIVSVSDLTAQSRDSILIIVGQVLDTLFVEKRLKKLEGFPRLRFPKTLAPLLCC